MSNGALYAIQLKIFADIMAITVAELQAQGRFTTAVQTSIDNISMCFTANMYAYAQML